MAAGDSGLRCLARAALRPERAGTYALGRGRLSRNHAAAGVRRLRRALGLGPADRRAGIAVLRPRPPAPDARGTTAAPASCNYYGRRGAVPPGAGARLGTRDRGSTGRRPRGRAGG